MPDARTKSDKPNRDNLDTVVNARVEDEYDDEEDSDYPSDLERGSASQAGNRVYTVTERPKTLFRRVSTSASAFAGWALDYDPKAAKEL
ncbi:Transmembrane protein [Phytophthora megakarya]|uniref:Transmembrane protein n=1 Tax=Phytophthora megakarya TaxID=4795 RepID=A0A225VGN0_9STRA|nr:Transmembrane protein [Phytophthora megakarya]